MAISPLQPLSSEDAPEAAADAEMAPAQDAVPTGWWASLSRALLVRQATHLYAARSGHWRLCYRRRRAQLGALVPVFFPQCGQYKWVAPRSLRPMVAADVDTLVEAPAASVVDAEMVVAVDTALASASETLAACVWKVGECVAWLDGIGGARVSK